MKNYFTCIIVDDEKDACALLENLLKPYNNLKVACSCNNVDSAFKRILEIRPDVIFLDIEMPEKDGFDLVMMLHEQTNLNPKVVFITAFDQYAIQAIKMSAFDYLLKPIERAELQKTIKKLDDDLERNNLDTKLDRLLSNFNKRRLRLNTLNGFVLVNPENIVYCEAEVNYTHIYYKNETHDIVTSNIGKVEDRLSPDCFMRISRSSLVNIDYIREGIRKNKKCKIQYNGANSSQTDHLVSI
jgi:DNA-binding LytR/AlgR family response regulator